MNKKIIFSLSSIIVFCLANPCKLFSQQKNNPPTIKIHEPLNKSSYSMNSQVYYRIAVSDAEDGESEYGEIASNEVFLEVRYIPDVSKINTSVLTTPDPNGLASMKKSNCFLCHAFNGKLIAPSFYEIAKRYPFNTLNTDLLTKKIRDGSSGIWGTASMPSHPELTYQQAQEIIKWILENGNDQNLNYYLGTEGSIRFKVPESANQKGAFILRATYLDHGNKNDHQQSLGAKNAIVVNAK